MIDVKSIFLGTAITAILMSLITFGVMRYSSRVSQGTNIKGILDLVFAYAILFVGFSLNAGRGALPEIVSSGLGSCAWAISVMLLLRASIRIQRFPAPWLRYAFHGLWVFCVFQMYIIATGVPFAYRTIFFSACVGITFLAACIIMIRSLDKEAPASRFASAIVGIGMFGNSMTMLLRAGYVYGAGNWELTADSLLHPTALNVSLSLVAFISLQMITFGFLFLFWQRAEVALTHAASTDALTQTLNRRALEETLNTHFPMVKNNRRTLSCILMDLDFFKKVNDTYGHATGDLVLKQFANTAKRFLDSQDAIGRFGGEEFLMLLVDKTPDQVAKTISELVSTFAEQNIATPMGPKQFTVSAGVSIATNSQSFDHWEDMIKSADIALYQAKSKGRNQWILFSQK